MGMLFTFQVTPTAKFSDGSARKINFGSLDGCEDDQYNGIIDFRQISKLFLTQDAFWNSVI